MTVTYRTSGHLTNPVSDLAAAREYLRVDGGMAQYIHPDDLRLLVHSVDWDLTDDRSWVVTVVTHQPLNAVALSVLSEWISGQNSDGLGEGFEQQPFAEHGSESDDEYDFEISSFDWGTNTCRLEVVI
jgi:hypothetical protein